MKSKLILISIIAFTTTNCATHLSKPNIPRSISKTYEPKVKKINRSIASDTTIPIDGSSTLPMNFSEWTSTSAESYVPSESDLKFNEEMKGKESCHFRITDFDDLNRKPIVDINIYHGITPDPLSRGYLHLFNSRNVPLENYKYGSQNEEFYEEYKDGVFTDITLLPEAGEGAYLMKRFYFSPDFKQFINAIFEIRKGGPKNQKFENRPLQARFICSSIPIARL